MKTSKRAVLKAAETGLEKAVARWAIRKMADYDDGVVGVFKDLFHGGCMSGYVGELVYYRDTCAFYNKHKEDIWDLIVEESEGMGETVLEFLSDCNGAKSLSCVDEFENFMAWLGFEEAARRLACRLEIDQ